MAKAVFEMTLPSLLILFSSSVGFTTAGCKYSNPEWKDRTAPELEKTEVNPHK